MLAKPAPHKIPLVKLALRSKLRLKHSPRTDLLPMPKVLRAPGMTTERPQRQPWMAGVIGGSGVLGGAVAAATGVLGGMTLAGLAGATALGVAGAAGIAALPYTSCLKPGVQRRDAVACNRPNSVRNREHSTAPTKSGQTKPTDRGRKTRRP
ncbi:hypothetical protein DFJ73DRAFT_757564 [Zopfochytrium polystomum]|nr:hypothetical protein DFJ73DRAFT_757564 [Zopfochytrium polystomum]